MDILKKIDKYLGEEVNKTIKIPLNNVEKKLIGDLKIYKEKYKLDRTQSNYRLDKKTFSNTFKEKDNLTELKKLIQKIKGK